MGRVMIPLLVVFLLTACGKEEKKPALEAYPTLTTQVKEVFVRVPYYVYVLLDSIRPAELEEAVSRESHIVLRLKSVKLATLKPSDPPKETLPLFSSASGEKVTAGIFFSRENSVNTRPEKDKDEHCGILSTNPSSEPLVLDGTYQLKFGKQRKIHPMYLPGDKGDVPKIVGYESQIYSWRLVPVSAERDRQPNTDFETFYLPEDEFIFYCILRMTASSESQGHQVLDIERQMPFKLFWRYRIIVPKEVQK